MTTNSTSLYERLGGIYAIAAVVDDFIDRIMINPILNANPLVDEAHHRVSKAGFKYLVTEMVGWATGGPQKYTGKTMKESHEHLGISESEWQSFLGDFQTTLDKFQVPAAEQRESRLDYLRFQISELKAEVGSAADIEQLFSEQKRFANRGRLASAARAALDLTDESETANAHDLLAKASAAIRSAAEGDAQLAIASGLLGEAQVAAREAAAALSRYLDALDVDPARLEDLERRVAALESLARKHRVAATDLPRVLDQAEREFASLSAADATLAGLELQLAGLARRYQESASRLTAARTQAAQELGAQISRLMQGLGMVGGRFEVRVEPLADTFSALGVDDIEFLVSANPGQPLKALARVASGGELSRISLAIQVAAAQETLAICRVFDEVDAGVGGAVAEIVGRQLRELGRRSQVLCVTHLPQVAAQAHGQFRVVKLSDGKSTRTAVNALTPGERVEEIARMLGGVSITDTAREHAREMLEQPGAQPAAREARKPRGRRST